MIVDLEPLANELIEKELILSLTKKLSAIKTNLTYLKLTLL
jgi:hypothetical protein